MEAHCVFTLVLRLDSKRQSYYFIVTLDATMHGFDIKLHMYMSHFTSQSFPTLYSLPHLPVRFHLNLSSFLSFLSPTLHLLALTLTLTRSLSVHHSPDKVTCESIVVTESIFSDLPLEKWKNNDPNPFDSFLHV